LFQITLSKDHSIKGPPLLKLINSLVQAGWITPGQTSERRLFFIVLSQVYVGFKKQGYLSSEGNVYRSIAAGILPAKQYVLKIDLESAVNGKSPVLQAPVQQDASMTA
ncbi:hypothetical protein BGX20_006658, partial [Mortierella sp. AD010]